MVLLVCCLASFFITSDIAMVNVALPSVVDSLAMNATQQQWFVNGYVLSYSALPLFMGRLADIYGHRRMFSIGLSVSSVAAILCAASPSTVVIEAARTLQGAGGAALAATTLSLLTTTYVGPAERRRAVGIWSATTGGGAVVGILLGGVLTSELGWRWVFVLSSVLAGAIFCVTVARVRPTPVDHLIRRLDVIGSCSISLGLALLVAGLIGARTSGWLTTPTVVLIVGGTIVLAFFLRHETSSNDPLLPVGLFANKRRIAAIAVTGLVGCNLYFLYFAISIFLQRAQLHGPSVAAVLTLPAALSVIAGSFSAALLSRRLDVRHQLFGSMVLLTAGFLWLSTLIMDGAYWLHIGMPLVVIGLGLGSSFVPATLLATEHIPLDRAGVASGVVNSARQIGRALGLAGLAGLVTSALAAPTAPARIAAAERQGFLICSAIAAVGTVLVMWLLPRGGHAFRRDDKEHVPPAVIDPLVGR